MQFSRRYQVLLFGGLLGLAGLCLIQSWPVAAQARLGRPTAKTVKPSSVNAPEQTVVPLTSGTAQTGTVNAQAGVLSGSSTPETARLQVKFCSSALSILGSPPQSHSTPSENVV